MRTKIKNFAKLLCPILAFPVLFIPYQLLNSAVIVKWLGCGCPKVDESGEMIHNYFSANDFTAIFWLVIAVCVTVLSAFLSKELFTEKKWTRVLCVVGVFVVSVFIAYWIIQTLMWN